MQRTLIVCFVLLSCLDVAAQGVGKPLSAEEYYRRGLEKTDLDQCEKAIPDFSAAIALDRSDARFFKARADCYQRELRSQKALDDLDTAIELKPDLAAAYVSRGRVNSFFVDENEELGGSPEQAESDFNRAIELEPARSEWYVDRANFYLRPDSISIEKGLADLETAKERNPQGTLPYLTKIRYYRENGKYENAIAECDQYIKKWPEYSFGNECRAEIYLELGRYKEAITDYTVVLTKMPNSAAFEGRAKAYRKLGKIRLAIADEKSARNFQPGQLPQMRTKKQ